MAAMASCPNCHQGLGSDLTCTVLFISKQSTRFQVSRASLPRSDMYQPFSCSAARPFVTETIWLGRVNHLRNNLAHNAPDNLSVRAKADKLLALQIDEWVMALYETRKHDPLIKYKDSIKRWSGWIGPRKRDWISDQEDPHPPRRKVHPAPRGWGIYVAIAANGGGAQIDGYARIAWIKAGVSNPQYSPTAAANAALPSSSLIASSAASETTLAAQHSGSVWMAIRMR